MSTVCWKSDYPALSESKYTVDKIKTTPYHPETNGVVERFHGTLKPMLTKAASKKLDWVGQIPFALFALRAAPNRETGFSPYELVFGRQIRTPLDILHQGWVEEEFEKFDCDEWADWLKARLEVWHDVMQEKGEHASRNRKKYFDNKAKERTLDVGDLVLCRLPGMTPKLQEAWHGPYEVKEKLNKVNYSVKLETGRCKVLHINNLKKYYLRNEEVLRIAVVAEDVVVEDSFKMRGSCETFNHKQIGELQKDFPMVFNDNPGETDVCNLEILTGEAPPFALPAHQLPERFRGGVKAEIEKLLASHVIRPSTSPWASPIVPVPKKDGSIRVCIDYRRLNSITQADPFYMITLDEILDRVGNSQCLSKLDLSKGYYQISIAEEEKKKTAFISQFGKYEFNRMPFGLKNAPAIFQRLMENVLRGCYDWAAPYIDDILVFSQNGIIHTQHLRLVVKALSENGLTLKLEKCIFGKTHLEYLGHFIGCGTVAVPENRASDMANYIRPRTKKQLRSFLGAASYYRRFVKNFAHFSAHLTPSTSKFSPNVVVWVDAMVEAFDQIKVSLVNICVLTIPCQGDMFSLHTDASSLGVGATLNVLREEDELPVAYFSRQLQGAQQFYSATELEMLAIYMSVIHFDHFLMGTEFKIITDHKALVYLLSAKKLNKRLYGWMLKLLDFSFEIIYRPGSMHQDADSLSRQNWNTSSFGRHEDWNISPTQPRAAGVLEKGGDVGTTPLERTEDQDQDCQT